MVEAVAPSAPALTLIKSARELATLLGVDYRRELSFVLHRLNPSRKYTTFEIPKRSGGTRIINKPTRMIMALQRSLLPHLQELYQAPPCVHGHVPGRSIKTNAAQHVDRRFVVNLDIAEFFPSIHFMRIDGILKSSRYGLSPKVARAISQLCCHDGTLPIGAPTSGVLSNIVCGPLDAKLLRLAKANHLQYTRYVDDITFSASNPSAMREGLGIILDGSFIARDISALSPDLMSIFSESRFQINDKKVWIVTKQARQQVTGLVVNRKINVSREYFRNLRASVHAIEKYSINLAQAYYQDKYQRSGAFLLKNSVLGKLSFLGHITGYDRRYSKIADRISLLFPDENILNPYKSREKSIYVAVTMPDEHQGTALHLGDGLFLTAAHLFPKGSVQVATLKCPFHYPNSFTAPVVNIDYDIDIALLRAPSAIREEKRPLIPIEDRRTYPGDHVEALGFPQYNDGNSCSYIDTKITARRPIGKITRMEVDRPLPHGASGGPIFDNYGTFSGIVFSGPALGSTDAPLATSFTPSSALADTVRGWIDAL